MSASISRSQARLIPNRLPDVVGLIAAVRKEYRARRAARQLEDLSDHLLRDLGISRDEVDCVVRYGRR